MPLEEIDQLRLNLLRQRRTADAGDEEAFIELDEEFHLLIARGARLPIVHRFLHSLRGFVRVKWLGSAPESGYLEVVHEHEQIVDAIERRDEEAATRALELHLDTIDSGLRASAGA